MRRCAIHLPRSVGCAAVLTAETEEANEMERVQETQETKEAHEKRAFKRALCMSLGNPYSNESIEQYGREI